MRGRAACCACGGERGQGFGSRDSIVHDRPGTILHAVTLGGTGKEDGDRHPKIGTSCVVGAGATLLGNIELGEGVTVGSQAVVTKSVQEGKTVVGMNKLLESRDSNTERARPDTWQYEVSERYQLDLGKERARDWGEGI